jgi:hypothetical protein
MKTLRAPDSSPSGTTGNRRRPVCRPRFSHRGRKYKLARGSRTPREHEDRCNDRNGRSYATGSSLASRGHISIPGMPASGLKKYGNLFVDLNYDSIRAGTRDTFTSSYAFMVRPSDMRLQSLLPTTWQEKTGAILGPERDTMERALKTFAGATGTMMFAVPLRRPDGTPNFIVITNDKREFVFDVGLRLMSFTTTPKRGGRKTIKYDLPVSSAEAIVIACAWDDLKDEAKLYVDGKEVP